MKRALEDARFSRQDHFDAVDTIDANLFVGSPDSRELDAHTEYIER
jgi:hypothetical protein